MAPERLGGMAAAGPGPSLGGGVGGALSAPRVERRDPRGRMEASRGSPAALLLPGWFVV